MDTPVETDLTGYDLINTPLLNKGTAFSDKERDDFDLHGLLPPHVGNLEEQIARMPDPGGRRVDAEFADDPGSRAGDASVVIQARRPARRHHPRVHVLPAQAYPGADRNGGAGATP